MNEHSIRWLVEIDGVLYAVEATGPDTWRLLALQGKRPGASYLIRHGTCDCPDFLFRGRPCKHIGSFAQIGLVATVGAAS